MLSLMQHALGRDDRSVVRKVLGGNLAAFRILVDRYGSVAHGKPVLQIRGKLPTYPQLLML